ncbi:MAG TPA: diaminopimelate epimerase [Pyrinomonadaceae bacterium]|nr:diaminopimelate epimerase [Pyrinomonadaceae bacterium]
MPVEFIKFHGYGNDYLVIETAQLAGVASLGEFARKITNRHYGAGADGIAVVSRSTNDAADFAVRIFNPDGSEAGLSGNGTRCAAAYLYYQKLWTAEELRLSTRSGVKRYFLRAETGPGKYVFASELGQPKLDSASVPLLTEKPLKQVVDYPLMVNGETFAITALQMGNPNCCIFVADFAALDWRSVGRAIETHQQFPDRTNVTFVRVLNREKIELRIWERGVGETTASGTCSCAAAVASMVNGKTERLVTALTTGGQVEIHWREDNEVVITGSAAVVYRGEWLGVE